LTTPNADAKDSGV